MLFILTFRVLFAICLIFKKFCVSCEPYTFAGLDFCKHNCRHNTQNGFCFCSEYTFIHFMGEALVCIRLFHMFLYMQVPIFFILVCFSPWFVWNLSAQSLSIHRSLMHSAILSACTVCLFSSYLVGMVCPDSSCYCVSYTKINNKLLLIISLYLLIFNFQIINVWCVWWQSILLCETSALPLHSLLYKQQEEVFCKQFWQQNRDSKCFVSL